MAVLFLALLGTATVAMPPRPLQIEDAVGMRIPVPVLPPATFSPDGVLVAYTACDPRDRGEADDAPPRRDAMRFTDGCSIHVAPVAGGATIAVGHAGAHWAPAWSPDGQRMAFFGNDADGVHLWIWQRDTQQVRRVADADVDVATGEEQPLWTADGRQLIARLPSTKPANADAMPGSPTGTAWSAPGQDGATVSVMRSGEPGGAKTPAASPYPPVDLATIDARDGTVTRLVQGAVIGGYWPSPDGRSIAFSTHAGQPEGQLTYHWTLELIGLAERHRRTLASFDQFHGISVRWSPDSRALAYFSGPQDASAAAAYVVALDGSAAQRLQGASDFGTQSTHTPLWDADGVHVYAIDAHTLWRGDVRSGRFASVGAWPGHALQRIVSTSAGNIAWAIDDGAAIHIIARDRATGRGELLRVAIATGATRVLRAADASISGMPLPAPDGSTLAYVAQSARRPQNIWLADAADLGEPRQLTHLNPELEAYPLGEARLIAFRTLDGQPLKATLLLPPGHVPGQRHPLVAWIYGGSMGSEHAWRFGLTMQAFNMHMLASRGYAVLYPDIPLRAGAHVQSLVDAVMPAIDAAIDQGYADPQRLALMGQSSGGYGTLALVTRTDRFKAAIACAGFGELASFHGHGWGPWLEHGDGAIGKAPWEAPDLYVANSPVYFLDRINTPLLLQAGGNDPAVGKFPAQVFAGLRQLDKPATYVEYAGEGHILSNHANLVDFWKRVTAFLDHHLSVPHDHGATVAP